MKFIGMKWVDLEFEEKAHVRALMREGKVRIEGAGADRRVVARGRERLT